jgi:hypothetical protein
MTTRFFRRRWFAVVSATCLASILCASTNPRQAATQDNASVATNSDSYFPAEAPGDVVIFSGFLKSIGEPSLLSHAQYSNDVHYRFLWLSGQTGRQLSVRADVNPDGSAEVTAADQFYSPRLLERSRHLVSDADLNKFLQLVDRAKFWTMPLTEGNKVSAGRRDITFDGGFWVFEGVSKGCYHVVVRRAPEKSSFTEMVTFLAKDMAKLSDATIPKARRVDHP